MAVQTELWVRDIASNLFADSSFMNRAKIDDEYLDGRVVHLPQAATKPNVEVNRATLPAAAAQRVDTDETYDVDEFSTDPIVIKDTEEIETNYAKRINIIEEHIMAIRERVGSQVSHNWSPTVAAQLIRTTGAARAAFKTGQTGTRKAITKADIVNARRLMDRMDVPQQGRVCLLDADMFSDILNIDDFVHADKIGGSGNLATGAVGRIFGFDVFVRSTVVLYDNAATPAKKAVGSLNAATDNAASLFYQPMFVRRAFGTRTNGGIEVYEKNKDPQFYGDVISAMVRAGSRLAGTDERGVVALIEEA
jgi:N4-gp56 family major capsid protein